MNSSAALKQAQNHPKNGKVTVNAQPCNDGASELNTLINDIGSFLPTTSLSITYHRVHIDRGTFLAKSPNSINGDWKTYGSGCEFLDHHSVKFFEFIGAKRKSKKKVELLDCILANLLSAYGAHSQLLYSRNKNDSDYLTTIQITDYLESQGLIINVIGKANEFEGNQSWMAPTELFKLEIERAKVRVGLRKNYSMLEIRGEDSQPLSVTRFKSRHVLDFKSISTSVQMYNQSWLDHDATLFGRPVVPFCRRIFNGDLNHGGRFYGGGHLTLPKDKRAQICIDGEVTIEPDFKSIHYCLLYAMKGIELNPIIDDPYNIEGFDRKTAKLASLVLLNSEGLSRFKANITKSGTPENKAIIAQYKEELTRFIMRSSQRLPAKRPIKPKLAHGFIEGMPDHINGADLLDAISQRHSAIADLFGTDRIGLKLQNSDSRIMAATLTQLAAVNIPVLPVHDSLRCRSSDLEATMSAMELAYKSVTGMNGFIAL